MYRKADTGGQHPLLLTGAMTYGEPARATTVRPQIRWLRVIALLGMVVAITAVLGSRHAVSSSATTASRILAHVRHAVPVEAGGPRLSRDEQGDALGESDGAIPDGTTVFDNEVPGVARLDPALLGALRQAAAAAASSGVAFDVDSGWRSAAYQESLLRQAIAKYGSESAALSWVATPATSAHVKGDAVDLAQPAASWLSEHGAAYGLCQIYGNEPWHFELRPEARQSGCPAEYANPTDDPRMQR